jgi:hypothetical protein
MGSIPRRNLYFVYLKYFDNLKQSLQDMKHTRGQGEFTDAWVRVVSGDIGTPVSASPQPSKPSTPVAPSIPVARDTNYNGYKIDGFKCSSICSCPKLRR